MLQLPHGKSSLDPSGQRRCPRSCHSLVRRHQFEVGAPLHFDEEYDRVSCLEYVLAAIGGDLVNGMRRLAHRCRLRVDQIEAVVEGELNNPLTYLGVVGESGHPGLEKVSVSIYVSTLEDEERVRVDEEGVFPKEALKAQRREIVRAALQGRSSVRGHGAHHRPRLRIHRARPLRNGAVLMKKPILSTN